MNDGIVDISGLDKAALLAALYNRARPLGMGFLHYTPEDMTLEQAQETLKVGDDHGHQGMYFDYLHGRVMKVDISGDVLHTWGYNRDNGDGAAEQVITTLRGE